ncbi:Aminoglycoside phosphotransferase family protein [Nostoc sp. DSM 114161]|jgi:5-methylthioribose kinase|uniref:phosphotransferase family protein n=1 Tax=Nostoc sp. DSM 114161 TaxID=3440143 RepID=UPI0040459D26
MTFILNSNNVFDYLVERDLLTQSEQSLTNIEAIPAKNFNLLLTLSDGGKLLVKQERCDRDGKTAGEFLDEWRIQELLQKFPELNYTKLFLPEVLDFDRENSIIVFKYLDNYRDLNDFYMNGNIFPPTIAAAIGSCIATIHRQTFNCQKYQDFFSPNSDNIKSDLVLLLIRKLEQIGPEIFGLVPADGLKFFALYQRYDSLGQALRELSTAFAPRCLTHNDLKLNNILLHQECEQSFPQAEVSQNGIVRLIDWERSSWGDPAFDLGSIITSYLQIWLNSLIVSKEMTIDESLRLATTPLESLQPSIYALTSAYLESFPEILVRYPDFIQRVVQFSGLALIQAIQSIIQYQKSFGNMGISMLQVAKSLLCRPEQSIPTVFGTTAAELTRLTSSGNEVLSNTI